MRSYGEPVREERLSISDAPIFAQEVRRGIENWSQMVIDKARADGTIRIERPAVAVAAGIWEIPDRMPGVASAFAGPGISFCADLEREKR